MRFLRLVQLFVQHKYWLIEFECYVVSSPAITNFFPLIIYRNKNNQILYFCMYEFVFKKIAFLIQSWFDPNLNFWEKLGFTILLNFATFFAFTYKHVFMKNIKLQRFEMFLELLHLTGISWKYILMTRDISLSLHQCNLWQLTFLR